MCGTLLQNELRTEPETFESDSKTHFRVDLSSNSHSNPIRKRIFAWTLSKNGLCFRFETSFSFGPFVKVTFESNSNARFCMDLLKTYPFHVRESVFGWAFRQIDFRIRLPFSGQADLGHHASTWMRFNRVRVMVHASLYQARFQTRHQSEIIPNMRW